MNSARYTLIFAAALLLFIKAFANAQEAAGPPSFDKGTLATGYYINDCLGFSYLLPEGWQINEQVLGTPLGVAKHGPGGGLVLLVLDQHTARPFFNRMVLSATDTKNLTYDTEKFVANFVQASAGSDQSRKILKEPYGVDLSGKHFFRADFTDSQGEAILYKTFLSTKFRGYFLAWTIVTGSSEELETAADSLKKIAFHQDERDPMCVMPPDQPSSTPAAANVPFKSERTASGEPTRVRISQQVSEKLIEQKVQPEYPELARQSRIQGTVVLKVDIDAKGNVEDVALVSGHPMLAPAAISAVKQWKWTPFLLNDKPMAVQTQVTVIFALQKQ